jgi:hypothetical protein
VILPIRADIRSWLPGDNLCDGAVVVPADTAAGRYDLAIGILGEHSDQPKVKLAMEGCLPDGWYRLGSIQVKQ